MKKIASYLKETFPIFLFLSLLVSFVYLPFLSNTFVADDDTGIALNRNIGSFRAAFNGFTGWIRPVLYAAAFRLGGLNPAFFRFPNIIFHLGATCLVFLLLDLISQRKKAVVTAAFFAVHPVLIESVTWISGGSYALYSFLVLLTLYLFILADRKKNVKLYFSSLIVFVFALIASEKSVVLPVLILLYVVSFKKIKELFKKKSLVELIPFFGMALLIGIVTLLAVGKREELFTKQYYQTVSGYDPLFQIPVAISFYLQLIFYPAILTLYHAEIISDPEYLLRVIITILFFIIFIVSYKKNKEIFFGLAFFLISILPTLNPLGVSSLFAERYVYLGTVGVLFAAVCLSLDIFERFKQSFLEVLIFVCILLLLSVRSIIRNGDWRTHEKFWTTAAETSPYSFQTHYNLATLYLRTGRIKEAAFEYDRTIVLAPKYADVYQDAGATYQSLHDVRRALAYYQKAVSLNPTLWKSLQNIGGIYFQAGKLDYAKEYTLKALKLAPNEVSLYLNLGIIYYRLGDKENATKAFETALKMSPHNKIAEQGLQKVGEMK